MTPMPSDVVSEDLESAQLVIVDAYRLFDQCAMTMTFPPFRWTANEIVAEEMYFTEWMAGHRELFPAWLVTLGYLLLALTLCFAGYVLVRPINFACGAYLGGSIALLVLKAVIKVQATCLTIVGIPTLAGLLLGSLAAWKRGSLFAVLGLIMGEVAGRYFYNSLLRPLGVPEQLAYTCIGFFAVVLIVVIEKVGDRTVSAVFASVGAFYTVSNFLQLLVVPFVDANTASRFNNFFYIQGPKLASLGHRDYDWQYLTYLTSDPFILLPLLVTIVLSVVGAVQQGRLLRQNKEYAIGRLRTEKAPLKPAKKGGRTTTVKKPTSQQVKNSALQMK